MEPAVTVGQFLEKLMTVQEQPYSYGKWNEYINLFCC